MTSTWFSSRSRSERCSRLLAVGALAFLLLLLLPSTARAHAVLEGGSIFDGQVLDVAPEELFLDFNEGITATRGGLRVFNSDGERVDTGGTFQTEDASDLVRVEMEPDLADGTYVVTYRVVSADGHPINGAFLFSIGEEAAGAEALLTSVFSSDADRPWAILAAIGRWAMYAATLLAAGLAITAWWLRSDIEPDEVAAGSGLAATAAIVVTVASVTGILLQNVLVTGDGAASLVDLAGLGAVAVSFVGVSAIVRILGAGLLFAAGRRRAIGGPLGLVGAGLALGSLLLEGHTLTTGPPAVVWGGATVHIATGATWFGGLVLMAMILRRRKRADDPVGAGRLVARFSSLFTVSVVLVVLAGSALSWAEVRAFRALDTSYGWVLLAKLAAVLPLLAIGVYNNRKLVPTLTARRGRSRRRSRVGAEAPAIAGGSDEVSERARGRDEAWAKLGRSIRVEVGLIVAVLALTGVLVSLQPAAEAAGITGAYSETVDFPGVGQMTMTVDPNRAGTNEVHIYLLSETGRPVTDVDDVTMFLDPLDLDTGTDTDTDTDADDGGTAIPRTPFVAGPGHWILAGPELFAPGRWEITVEAAVSRFEVTSTSVQVVVNP